AWRTPPAPVENLELVAGEHDRPFVDERLVDVTAGPLVAGETDLVCAQRVANRGRHDMLGRVVVEQRRLAAVPTAARPWSTFTRHNATVARNEKHVRTLRIPLRRAIRDRRLPGPVVEGG